MSHTITIKTKFKDLDILKKTFLQLGWSIVENSTLRGYAGLSLYQSKLSYSLVAKNPNTGADIAITTDNANEISLIGDMACPTVSKTLGQNLSKLRQHYAFNIIEDEFLFQGANITKTELENGNWIVEVET